jgi:uncharacterized membrane protein YfcA
VAEPILLALLGAVAGLIGALLGIGGGVILVPVLYLACDLPLIVAVGTSLIVVTGTSLAGAAGYLERDLVLTDVALELQLGAMVGALTAARAAAFVPERTVAIVFAVVMVWSALSLWWRRGRADGAEVPATGGRRWAARLLSPAGGVASGLLGIGGGLVHVPLLRLVLSIEMRRAVATSTWMVGLTASLAAAVYVTRGDADFARAPWLLAGILAGGAAAPRLAARLPRRALEIGFALAALYGAYRMVRG